MATLFDLVKVNTPTAGTGDVTFGAAFDASFFTPSEAGCVDGDKVRYVLLDGTDVETGEGTIGGSVTTMARTTVAKSKIGGIVGTSKIALSGTAILAFTATSTDIANKAVANSFLDTTDSTSPTTGSQKLAGGLGVAKDINWGGSALTAYTPIQSGTASGSCNGFYKLFGKMMWLYVEFIATSTGTTILSMPSGLAGPTGLNNQFLPGFNSVSGNLIFGYTTTNNGKIAMKTPTFTDPATSGARLAVSGTIYIN